jgi:hypothetical protein
MNRLACVIIMAAGLSQAAAKSTSTVFVQAGAPVSKAARSVGVARSVGQSANMSAREKRRALHVRMERLRAEIAKADRQLADARDDRERAGCRLRLDSLRARMIVLLKMDALAGRRTPLKR